MTSRSLQREDYSPFPNNFTPKHLEKDIEDSPFFRRLKETADKEPGFLTVAQRDFVRMWHTQADGVYTLRQDFVQTAFDHIKSQGHAWSLYHDIWDNLGRLLPMADIGRHASRVHTEDGFNFPPLLRFSGGDVQISGGPWASCRLPSVGDEHHRLLAHVHQWGWNFRLFVRPMPIICRGAPSGGTSQEPAKPAPFLAINHPSWI